MCFVNQDQRLSCFSSRKEYGFYMENQNQNIKKKKTWKPRPRYMGVVISWNRERKFGFIRCYDDGQSYFAHCTQLTDDYELVSGSVVEFEIWQSKQEPDNGSGDSEIKDEKDE